MASSAYPSLYQINSRVWLTELSRTLASAQHWTEKRADPFGLEFWTESAGCRIWVGILET